MGQDFREIASAQLTPASEKQYAGWHEQIGQPVTLCRGRYWKSMARGFFEPIHWMARLRSGEVSRPATACWGFRASLHEDASGRANSALPMNLLSDLEHYTMENLPAKRRTDLRKCRKTVSIVQLLPEAGAGARAGQGTGPAIYREQGYDVASSAARRTGVVGPGDRQQYQRTDVEAFPNQPFQIVIAGIVGGRLGGYVKAYAVEDVAYLFKVKIATEFLPTAIGTGLTFEFVQLCRRTPGIRHVVYGLHSPEDPRLVAFKEGMGFKSLGIPSYLWMLPGLRLLLRWRRPYPFYRLSGILPAAPGTGPPHRCHTVSAGGPAERG